MTAAVSGPSWEKGIPAPLWLTKTVLPSAAPCGHSDPSGPADGFVLQGLLPEGWVILCLVCTVLCLSSWYHISFESLGLSPGDYLCWFATPLQYLDLVPAAELCKVSQVRESSPLLSRSTCVPMPLPWLLCFLRAILVAQSCQNRITTNWVT